MLFGWKRLCLWKTYMDSANVVQMAMMKTHVVRIQNGPYKSGLSLITLLKLPFFIKITGTKLLQTLYLTCFVDTLK